MMNLKEVQYVPGACQQTVIHNTLSLFYTKSFKQIGILHAFNINLFAGHWIERNKVSITFCWLWIEIILF